MSKATVVFALIAIGLLDVGIAVGIGAMQAPGSALPSVLHSLQRVLLLTAVVPAALSVWAAFRPIPAGRIPLFDTRASPRLVRVVGGSAYLTIVLLAAAWASWNYRIDGVLVWPDTTEYVAAASEPLTSPAFWTIGNPPGLALVFKIFGLTKETFESQEFPAIARHITQFLTAFSLLTAGMLGFSIASSLRTPWLRPPAVLTVFGLALATDVAQWNKMLLSESLSTSLFFGVLAGVNALIRWRGGGAVRERALRGACLVAVCLGTLLFAFTRDVNAYVLLALAGVLLPAALLSALRKPRRWVLAATLGIVLLAGGSAAATAAQSWRWSYPFVNLIHDRVLPDPSAVEFFASYGLPFDDIEAIHPTDLTEFHIAFRSDPRAEPLRAWFGAKGRSVYLKFLLSRPLATLRAPLPYLTELLSPDVSRYRVRLHDEPAWMFVASSVAFPTSALGLVVWFSIVIVMTAILVRAGLAEATWAIPLMTLALLYPLLLAIWHGDSAALQRHSLPIGVGLRLSLWLLSFLVLDALVVRAHTDAAERPVPVPA